LRVDDEWVARAGVNDRGVLKRDTISGETFGLPASLVRGGREYEERVNSLGERNLLVDDVGEPLVLPKLSTELL